jgi:hypothetical protein
MDDEEEWTKEGTEKNDVESNMIFRLRKHTGACLLSIYRYMRKYREDDMYTVSLPARLPGLRARAPHSTDGARDTEGGRHRLPQRQASDCATHGVRGRDETVRRGAGDPRGAPARAASRVSTSHASTSRRRTSKTPQTRSPGEGETCPYLTINHQHTLTLHST